MKYTDFSIFMPTPYKFHSDNSVDKAGVLHPSAILNVLE